MCTRVCMRMRMIEGNRTHDHDQHTNGTHDNRKREEHQQAGKSEYICMIAGNEKKNKKVKKNLEIRKSRRIFVAVIKIKQHYERDNY